MAESPVDFYDHLKSWFPGKLIVFEGADEVGKTTVIRKLGGCLHSIGVEYKQFSFPGSQKGTIGQLVYDLHHNPDKFGISNLSATSLQTLHIAAHIDQLERYILPALKSGFCILLDRFWWSTWVYGIVAGITSEVLKPLIQCEINVWGKIRPDAIIYLVKSGAGIPDINKEYASLVDNESKFVRVINIETQTDSIKTTNSVLAALLDLSPEDLTQFSNIVRFD